MTVPNAASEWRVRAAAALCKTTQQLPPDQGPITTLLNQAAASCVQQLLSAAPANHQFASKQLLPVLQAAVAACNPGAVAVTLAVGASKMWTAAMVEQQLVVAAKKGCDSIFKLLVKAAEVAEIEEVPEGGGNPAAEEAAEGQQLGKMRALKGALQAAVQQKQQALADWVLERGLQAGGWTAGNMEPAVTACIKMGRSKQLKQLLVGCKIAWQQSELTEHVEAAIGMGKHSVALLKQLFSAAGVTPEVPWTDLGLSLEVALRGADREKRWFWSVVQLLLEVVKAGWQAGDLEGALVAAMHPTKDKKHLLKLLLSLPGVVWEGEVVEKAAFVGFFWRSWSCLEDLVSAEQVIWNAQQLEDVLSKALQHDRHELVSMVLAKGAMDFAGDAMAAAAVTAAVTSAGAQQGKMGALELLLGRWEGWSAAVLQDGLLAAAKVGNSVVLQLLLEVPGVVWGRWALQPAIEAAAGSRKWKAVRLLLGVEGVRWEAVQLAQVMVHAAAAGKVEVVRALLVMVEHGWVGEEMAAAAAAAVAGKHWEILRELLGVEGAGWVAGDLQGMLGMAIGGGIEDVGMLLEVPGVVWEVAEAIEVAERQGNMKVAQQLRAV